MAASGAMIDLRRFLAERFPQSPVSTPGHFCSGVSTLDQAIGGGLPKSAITELITPQTSAGSASLLQGMIQSAQCHGYFLALIDGSDSLDPEPLGNESLRSLLWVRCRQALEAIKAADLLLRDGNFPLVMVDLVLNPLAELRRIPQTTWYRLQRLVEASPSACLVLTRQSMVASAQLKIVLENSWMLESLKAEDARSRLRFRIQRSHLKLEGVRAACHAEVPRRRVGALT
ncbi:MAG: hypothetical protein ACREIW_13645 [Chthoniobacterales bacterium]